MKKKIILIGFCLVGGILSAQNLTDGLRYSMEELDGTARFKAMSGAFTSLGGDLSAISINPAGSTIFAGGEISVTIANNNTKNAGTRTINSSDFSFSQFGIAVPVSIGSEGWKNIAFGFNYQQTHNFTPQDIHYSGPSNKNLGDYFQYYANGIEQENLMLVEYGVDKRPSRRWRLDNLYSAYGQAVRFSPFKLRNALLGYTAGLIKPQSGKTAIDPSMTDAEANAVKNETTYVSNVSGTTFQNIEHYTEGGVNRYNFNFAAKYDIFSFGINLNSHNVDYREVTRHRENYLNNTASGVRSAYFQNELKTTGSGFSLQLGAIAKIAEGVRIGLSYTSPTWYNLQDETTQSLRVTTESNGDFWANPNVVAVYDRYRFRTPASWTVGASWVWNKSLILSGDYMYKGYGKIHYSSDNLKSENSIIQQTLGDTSTLRFGAEYRFLVNNKLNLFLRGGYRYQQSPYKGDEKYIGNLNGFSTGTGIAFKGMRFDLSYDIAKQDHQPQFYESVLTSSTKFERTYQNLLFSFSFKF